MTAKIQLISTITAALVGIVALFAFVLSYSSLQHMAASNGVNGWLSFLWPLLLDFSMVVFSLAILRANLRQEAALYAWLLTVTFASLATIANVLDVTSLGISPVIVSSGVKAIAPIALVLSFELLMSMVKAEVKRAGVTIGIRELSGQLTELDRQMTNVTKRLETKQAELSKVETISMTNDMTNGQMSSTLDIANDKRQMTIDSRRQEVLSLVNEGLTADDIADQMGVSVRTITRDIKTLNGKVAK
jgi:DNA-binding NarL/FixJ family response regulator